jgi:ATP-dependent DNA helicase RecQ
MTDSITAEQIADQSAELLRSLAGPQATLRDDQLTAIDALVRQRRRVFVCQATGWG